MVAFSQFGSPGFRLVVKGLVELHQLISEGKDDSAEAVRDALDGPLQTLNRIEKERAQWLSEDLYSVSEPPGADCPQTLDAEGQRQLLQASEARQRRQWDAALELFRRLREHAPPALLSNLRGTIWSDAGYPEIAAVFFKHSMECDPGNGNYRALYLKALAESDAQKIAVGEWLST